MKKVIALFIFFSTFFSAQFFEEFPPNQINYEGGRVQFYKDFHNTLQEQKLKPCSNKDEYYLFKIVIYPDAKIKYVKDEDTIQTKQNKCTFDLSRNVAKYLKGWKPAIINGEKTAAVTSFWIFPDDLFENYKEGYDAEQFVTNAEFKGGINEFRRKLINSIDLSRYRANRNFKLIVTFVVNTEGKIEDVKLAESTANKEFNKYIISSIKSIKDDWTPAKIRNLRVKSRFTIPLSFNFE